MHIWQHRVALLSAKLMMAALEDQGKCSSGSGHIRTDVWKHFKKTGASLHYVDFCNKEYAYLGNLQLFSETATTCDYTKPEC